MERIFKQEYREPFEVLVIDFGSTDETVRIAEEFPTRVFKIGSENLTHGQTRNVGAKLAEAKYLVFISGDAVPVSNKWLQKLTEALKNPEVAGVYGKQIPNQNTNPMEKFLLSVRYPPQKIVRSKNSVLKKLFFNDRPVISNVNSAIRKEIWRKYNFPEKVIIAEDKAWGKKVLLDGYNIIYEPEASVYHSHNYNLKTVFLRYFDEGVALNQIYEHSEFNIRMQFIIGIRYVLQEFIFLLRNGYALWIPYAAIYNFMKFFAMFLGTKEQYLPLSLKKALSKFEKYWNTSGDE